MSELAAIRADSVDLPLFVHVLGAMLLVGAIVLAATFLFSAWRTGALDSLRSGFRALLYGAIPGYIVMRVGAEWVYDKEGLNDLPEDPDWAGIGYIAADLGLLVLLVAMIAAGVAMRRARRATEPAAAGVGVRVAAVLIALLIVMDVIAIWAMTTKPV